ncbi:centrosome and spindle pole-associated protein 1 isoform X4 [Arapaima gigas]
MGDVVHSFLGVKTTELATEKVTMGQDPPYMEIRAKAENAYNTSMKENIPPSKSSSQEELQANPAKEAGLGLSLPLGEEYDRKKQRLQQELRQDYRRYVAQEKLRNDRRKEHLAFLKGQKGKGKMQQNLTAASQQPNNVADSTFVQPNRNEKPQSRRDAATLTEGRWETPSRQKPGRRWRRSWAVHQEHNSEPSSSEEELLILTRKQSQARHEHRRVERSRHRLSKRPTRRERVSSGDYEEDYRETNRKSLSVSPKPTLQEPGPVMPNQRSQSAASKDGTRFVTGLIIGVAEDDLVKQQRKDRYRQELLDQIAEHQRNKKREKELGLLVAATGAVDPDKLPNRIRQFFAVTGDHNGSRREVPYRLAPDTIHGAKDKPLPDVEERSPPEKPSIAFQSPVLDYSTAVPPLAGSRAAGPVGGGLTGHNEDFHKSLSSTLGEIAALRMPAVPPPMLPTLADSYRTPYDNAYYCYGARNSLVPALVPSLAHGEVTGNGGGEYPVAHLKPLPRLGQPTQVGLPGQQVQLTGEGDPAPSGMETGAIPGVTAHKSNYQEALKLQIREREELRKQEEDERQSYETKLAREMEAYNPWGRGGGGAPLRDNQGNLFADLKQMHKFNKEAYLNPSSQKQLLAAGTSPLAETEDHPLSPQRTSGILFAQTSPFARGNVFPELSERQKVHGQEKYKDDLRKQIEEKRQKEAEERERLRIQEEKEEKRVAEELAKMRREYEEEQEKRRRKEMEMMRQAEEWRRQREEKKKEEEEQKQKEEQKREEEEKKQKEKEKHDKEMVKLQSELGRPNWDEEENAKNEDNKKHEKVWLKQKEENSKDRKNHRELLTLQSKKERPYRESSPPVPALRKKLATQHTNRPPSVDSYCPPSAMSVSFMWASGFCSRTEVSLSVSLTEEHKGVIGELSVLRRLLRGKQKQLEEELLQTKEKQDDVHHPIMKHHPMDLFHMSKPVALKRTSHKAAEMINQQNILDFNKLKCRDSESREEVRRLYPDPPTDDQSLDVQQQALIREQQRRIDRLKNTGFADELLFKNENMKNPTKNLARGNMLTSECAPEENTSQTLVREQRRLANWPEPDGELTGETNLNSQHSAASLRMKDHKKQRLKRLQELRDQGWLDELDTSTENGDLPLHTVELNSEGRQSVDTVATEPWLRPGPVHIPQLSLSQGVPLLVWFCKNLRQDSNK